MRCSRAARVVAADGSSRDRPAFAGVVVRIRIDDVRLFFDVAGSGLVAEGPGMRERPVVLLIPGGPGQELSFFKPAFEPLADVAQLVYVDPRGCGRSDRGDPDRWTLTTWTDDVARFCDTLGIEHPIILGASFGGMVALSFAAAYPDRPASLVLAMTGLGMRPGLASAAFGRLYGEPVRRVFDRYWRNPGRETFEEYLGVCLPLYARIHASPDELSRSRLNLELMERFWSGPMRSVDLREAASRVRCPVLIIVGELDPILPPAASEELLAALPPGAASLPVLPGAAHSGRDLVEAGALGIVREFLLQGATGPAGQSMP
jgi:pimeloyl-ACP methyl ester carboxylesterase